LADAQEAANMEPSAEAVAAFLRRHPGFLAEHPDLAQVLVPPARRGDGIPDIQTYLIEKLRGDVSGLKSQQSDLVQTSRANLASQARVHAAVVALLGASTLEHAIEIVTTDFAVLLEVDQAVLGLEATDRVQATAQRHGLRVLAKGKVDELIPGRRDVMLHEDRPGDPMLFGGGATLVRSQVLMRLDARREAPIGVLALGVRHAGRFHAGQGTELLVFLAQVVALTLRAWLDRR
jgi:uncharacterized protein YigA (DUF484 family)